jgi:hypothetical protein
VSPLDHCERGHWIFVDVARYSVAVGHAKTFPRAPSCILEIGVSAVLVARLEDICLLNRISAKVDSCLVLCEPTRVLRVPRPHTRPFPCFLWCYLREVSTGMASRRSSPRPRRSTLSIVPRFTTSVKWAMPDMGNPALPHCSRQPIADRYYVGL